MTFCVCALFPPRSPSALPGFRSTASLVLRRCTTPRCRSSGPYSSSPSPSGPCPTHHGRPRGLTVLVRDVSIHAGGLRLRRTHCVLAFTLASVWPSVQLDAVGARIARFRSSPLRAQRFKCVVARRPRMVLGSGGIATPFLYDSFIHYFTPVYPDAIQAKAYATSERPAIL